MNNYFQDAMSGNYCFGCGKDNPKGLQLKSYWRDQDQAECIFQPQSHHAAGPEQYLNGGIIATIIDCHSICSAIAKHYQLEERAIGQGEKIWCVTAGMSLKYLKPVPIAEPVQLLADFSDVKGKKIDVRCRLYSEDKLCVESQVIAIRVPLSWLGEQAAHGT